MDVLHTVIDLKCALMVELYKSSCLAFYYIVFIFFLNMVLCHFMQLLNMHKEMQKQMTTMVAVPVTREGKRLEAALGRSMEKAVKANNDALWARFQEENAKNDKLLRERFQQITSLISNFLNKDLQSLLEKTLRKEIAAVGTSIVRTITPTIEKTVSSAIADAFQVSIFKFMIYKFL